MLMRLGRRSSRWQLTSDQLPERALDRLGLRVAVPPGHRDRRVAGDLRERKGVAARLGQPGERGMTKTVRFEPLERVARGLKRPHRPCVIVLRRALLKMTGP